MIKNAASVLGSLLRNNSLRRSFTTDRIPVYRASLDANPWAPGSQAARDIAGPTGKHLTESFMSNYPWERKPSSLSALGYASARARSHGEYPWIHGYDALPASPEAPPGMAFPRLFGNDASFDDWSRLANKFGRPRTYRAMEDVADTFDPKGGRTYLVSGSRNDWRGDSGGFVDNELLKSIDVRSPGLTRLRPAARGPGAPGRALETVLPNENLIHRKSLDPDKVKWLINRLIRGGKNP